MLGPDTHARLLLIVAVAWTVNFFSATVGGDGLLYYSYLKGKPTNLAPGTALFTLPFYAASLPLHGIVHYRDDAYIALQGDTFVHSLFFSIGLTAYSLAGLMLVYAMCKRYSSGRIAFQTALAVFFGTLWVFYSDSTIWPSQPVSVFFVAATLYAWQVWRGSGDKKKHAIIGLLAASSALVRYETVTIFIPLLIWYVLRKRSGLVPFVASFSAIVATLLFFWWGVIRINSLGSTPYGNISTTGVVPFLYAFYALFNPDHGLLWFHPILILAITGLILLYGREKELALMSASFFLALLLGVDLADNLIFKSYNIGQYCFSARFLITTVPPLSLGLMEVIRRFRTRSVSIAIFVLTGFSLFLAMGWTFSISHGNVADIGKNYVSDYFFPIITGSVTVAQLVHGIDYASKLPLYALPIWAASIALVIVRGLKRN